MPASLYQEDGPTATPNTTKPTISAGRPAPAPPPARSTWHYPVTVDTDEDDLYFVDDELTIIPSQPTRRPGPANPNRMPRVPPVTPPRVRRTRPAASSPRRKQPLGVYLGTWRGSGLPSAQANAVYGSRDSLNRINRRVSKETNHGTIVDGGNYNARKTACSHADINYLPTYHGMSRREVDDAIMPLLTAAANADPFGNAGISGSLSRHRAG